MKNQGSLYFSCMKLKLIYQTHFVVAAQRSTMEEVYN